MEWAPVLPIIFDGVRKLFGRRKKNDDHNNNNNNNSSFDNGAFIKAQEQINKLMAEKNQLQIDFNQFMKKYEESSKKLNELQQLMEDQKITSFAKLNAAQRRQFEAAVNICETLPPTPLPPNTIGFIGPCGVGKSYLINSVSGRAKLVGVGRNQTTFEINSYLVNNVAYIDIPGSNDAISYLSAEYIGVFKALKFIAVVVDRSIDQSSEICVLLERLSIPFIIICNKCDYKMDEEGGIDNFKTKFIREVIRHNFKTININNDIYFVSAEFPATTPGTNWEELINRIVDKVGAENFYPSPTHSVLCAPPAESA